MRRVDYWLYPKSYVGVRGNRMESTSRLFGMLAAVAFVLGTAAPSAAIDVTACGQSFAGQGMLTGDLDCTGHATSAVVVESGSLELAGFTLTGGLAHGVVCQHRCDIVGGGGSVVGAAVDGIHNAGTKLSVSGVTISGNGRHGIGATEDEPYAVRRSRVIVSNAVIANNDGQGINARNATVSDSTISGNGASGMFIPKLAIVSGSEITDNASDGIYCEGVVRLGNSTLSGNGGNGVRGIRKTEVTSSTVSVNAEAGVAGQKLIVSGATISGNDVGLFGSRLMRAQGSTICGNGGDFFGGGRVQLIATACEGPSSCSPCP